MWFRIISFLTGYVEILVRGKFPEKFVNMAAARGIFLWDVWQSRNGEFSLKVGLRDIYSLRHIARKTGCRFFIRRRVGFPFFLSRLRRRKVLAAGAVFFLVTLYLLSILVWHIEVVGNENITSRVILQVAAREGLVRGVPRWKVDAGRLEEALLEQFPQLAWVGVYREGTRVTIEVVEKKPLPKENRAPCHVVAKKDGLVEEMLVLKGLPLVGEGDTVTEGQILISGEIPVTSGEGNEELKKMEYVQARGVVRARVWYEGYGEEELVKTGVRRTGRSVTRVCMRTGDGEIILMGPRQIPFKYFAEETLWKSPGGWRNIHLPVEFITRRYYEREIYTVTQTRSEALRVARNRALKDAMRTVPPEGKVLRQTVREVGTVHPENLVRVKVLLEVMEDIGEQKPFEPEEGSS